MKIRGLKELILAHSEGFILVVILLGILAIALLVHYQFSFLNFFFLPVILSGYFLGKKKTVLLAFLCVLLVVLYLSLQNVLFGGKIRLSFDDLISITTWAGFLILTGGLLGSLAEQRENKLSSMKRAYMGVLAVLLKYLEFADEVEPRSVHIARLAGQMAEKAGLSRRDAENIKSAALLCEAGELRSNLPLFENVANFMGTEKNRGRGLTDRDQVLLQTTASLIREIGPLLEGYYQHYVLEAGIVDKDLETVPLGSSLIALAELYDKLMAQGSAWLGKTEIRSLKELQGLKNRSFPEQAVGALPEILC